MLRAQLVAAWHAIDVLPFGHEPTRIVAVVATMLGIQVRKSRARAHHTL